MADAVTSTDLQNEFGAYFQDRGQRQENIHKVLYNTGELENFGLVEFTNDEILEEALVDVDGTVQAFHVNWQPDASVTFTGRKAVLHQMKQDFEIVPDNHYRGYLGFMDANDLDRSQHPFSGYILQLVMEKTRENWVMFEEYAGVRSENNGVDLNLKGENIDGWKVLNNRDIDAGLTTPFVMGAIPTDPVQFYDYIVDMIEQLPVPYRKKGGVWQMRYDLEYLFREGVRQKFNVNYESMANRVGVYHYPQFSVKGFVEYGSSDKILLTAPENMLTLVKKPTNENIFLMEGLPPGKRKVWVTANNWWKGKHYKDPRAVFVNDQDTALPV